MLSDDAFTGAYGLVGEGGLYRNDTRKEQNGTDVLSVRTDWK